MFVCESGESRGITGQVLVAGNDDSVFTIRAQTPVEVLVTLQRPIEAELLVFLEDISRQNEFQRFIAHRLGAVRAL